MDVMCSHVNSWNDVTDMFCFYFKNSKWYRIHVLSERMAIFKKKRISGWKRSFRMKLNKEFKKREFMEFDDEDVLFVLNLFFSAWSQIKKGIDTIVENSTRFDLSDDQEQDGHWKRRIKLKQKQKKM